jgi:hypothetical protein
MKKSTNNSSKPNHLLRRVFNNMDDISEFELDLLMDETTDEQKLDLFASDTKKDMTPKERATYLKKITDEGKRSTKGAHVEFAHIAEQYHSGSRNEFVATLPPILFKQVGTTPMSVPYLKVYVSASVGQEDVLHSLYTLAR